MKKTKIILCALLLLAQIDLSISAKEYELSSDVYILTDQNTGEVVDSKNETRLIHPASMTKIMTTYVAIKEIGKERMDDTFVMTHEIFFDLVAQDASVAGFDAGESVKVIDILYGIMLPSGADATRAIATYISGDETEFVAVMNRYAHEMGLKNTWFENTSGLDSPNHLTTAQDLTKILLVALKDPLFKEIFETEAYTSSPTNYKKTGYTWVDKNLEYARKKYNNSPLTGAKSGYTELAGSSLASTGVIDTKSYILITSGADYSPFEFFNVQDAVSIYTGKRELPPSPNQKTDKKKDVTKRIPVQKKSTGKSLISSPVVLFIVLGLLIVGLIVVMNKIMHDA